MSCIFFFSSRRRHTRSLCDWSSDVCSSDLRYMKVLPAAMREGIFKGLLANDIIGLQTSLDVHNFLRCCVELMRSEERRVGKEGRGRGGRGQEEERQKG